MTRDQMFSLEGKTAVVTGGARGIGKVVASHLSMMGADIALVDILDTAETAKSIKDEHGTNVNSYICDVTDYSQVSEVIDLIAADFGKLDILFNNAGIVLHKAALDVTESEWKQVLDVNLNGVFYMAQAFAKKLTRQKSGGSIINTASMSASIVNIPQQQASYNASKAAVVHLTKSLAVEWAELGIRVNSISPGYTATELIGSVSKDWIDVWVAATPFKRMGKPEELSGAVVYLASDSASFTSGCDIVIDGCFTLV